MGIHILWLVIWLISGAAGWFVAAITGMVIGQVIVDRPGGPGWRFLWVPVIWLLGAAWGLFALVHAIIELIAVILNVVQVGIS